MKTCVAANVFIIWDGMQMVLGLRRFGKLKGEGDAGRLQDELEVIPFTQVFHKNEMIIEIPRWVCGCSVFHFGKQSIRTALYV